MFCFFKIIQQLILPSIFIFFLFLLSLFLILKKKKAGKYLLIFSIFLYYFFSITPTSDLLICPLEKGYSQKQDKQKIPFIVVLSGGFASQLEEDENSLSESSLKRAVKAFKIYQESSLKPKIILSGNFSSFKNEAEEMANFLFSLGVPKEDIIIEKEAKNTWQSAKKVKNLVAEKKFFLVTSAFHLKRAEMAFRKNNLKPILIASDFRCQGKYDFFDFLPEPNNFKKANLAFHEYFGWLFYKFFLN